MASEGDTTGMSDEQKRRDQLLRMSGSTESDAAARIDVSEHDGVTRIDIADTAAVRPGPGPDASDDAPDASDDAPHDLRASGEKFDEELMQAEDEADAEFER